MSFGFSAHVWMSWRIKNLSMPHNNLTETRTWVPVSFRKAHGLFWLVLSGQVAYFSREIWQRRHPEKQTCVTCDVKGEKNQIWVTFSCGVRPLMLKVKRTSSGFSARALGVRGRRWAPAGCNGYISVGRSSWLVFWLVRRVLTAVANLSGDADSHALSRDELEAEIWPSYNKYCASQRLGGLETNQQTIMNKSFLMGNDVLLGEKKIPVWLSSDRY